MPKIGLIGRLSFSTTEHLNDKSNKMRELLTKLFWISWFSSFTIEFAVMFSKMSHGVSGVLRTDMALAKVCLIELRYNQTVCDNMKNHSDVQVNILIMLLI